MPGTPEPTDSIREFIEYVARLLARSPDAVQVTETAGERGVVYRVKLAPEDVGRVIGREGRVIQSIRSLLRAAAVRQGIRLAIEVD